MDIVIPGDTCSRVHETVLLKKLKNIRILSGKLEECGVCVKNVGYM